MDLINIGSVFMKRDIKNAKILIGFMIEKGDDIHHVDYFGVNKIRSENIS